MCISVCDELRDGDAEDVAVCDLCEGGLAYRLGGGRGREGENEEAEEGGEEGELHGEARLMFDAEVEG